LCQLNSCAVEGTGTDAADNNPDNCVSSGEQPPGYGSGGGGFVIDYGSCITNSQGESVCSIEQYDPCKESCVGFSDPCIWNECQQLGIPAEICPSFKVIGCGISNFLPDESTNQTLLNVKIVLNNEEVCIPILCDTGCDEYELCEES
jgi:hypothetical protein